MQEFHKTIYKSLFTLLHKHQFYCVCVSLHRVFLFILMINSPNAYHYIQSVFSNQQWSTTSLSHWVTVLGQCSEWEENIPWKHLKNLTFLSKILTPSYRSDENLVVHFNWLLPFVQWCTGVAVSCRVAEMKWLVRIESGAKYKEVLEWNLQIAYKTPNVLEWPSQRTSVVCLCLCEQLLLKILICKLVKGLQWRSPWKFFKWFHQLICMHIFNCTSIFVYHSYINEKNAF